MPAGLPYFAWIDADEDTFEPEHMRWDENVFSFELAQSEGDPANLTVVVRRPRNEEGERIGLLGPGRKIWAWFALDCGPALFKFRGRLVGIPTSIFEELVTLEFVARPFDVVAQKEALAETLRVLPYYDEVVIDPASRSDPEVVLEGYTAIWHYDRETHLLTVSDEITGEDGTLDFDGTSVDGKVLYDGLGLQLTSGPLSRVDVTAEYTWTQLAQGGVDLTDYLGERMGTALDTDGSSGVVVSFTFKADDWPKIGSALGDGWEVKNATASAVYNTETLTREASSEITVKWYDGATTNVKQSGTETYLAETPPGSYGFPWACTKDDSKTTYATDGKGERYASSFNRSTELKRAVVVAHHTRATLEAGYTAQRPFTERVTFSMFADVQHILTDPEDGEALRLDGIRSVNLSEGDAPPIGDTRRNSYIATARGKQSLEHLIALARAHLMKRARVVEISFAPKLARMPEITLRKNVLLNEPRVGEALGKIIGYTLALDGADGRIKCEVRIGCSIGRGGSVVEVEGTPTYCTIDYTGADYQQFAGRTVLFDGDNDAVGYEPPSAAPDDDGIDFLSDLEAEDVIDQDVTVENPIEEQREYIAEYAAAWPGGFGVVEDEFVTQATNAINEVLKQVPTRWQFKLKSMSREFTTDYPIEVTDLHIPLGYDLEAA